MDVTLVDGTLMDVTVGTITISWTRMCVSIKTITYITNIATTNITTSITVCIWASIGDVARIVDVVYVYVTCITGKSNNVAMTSVAAWGLEICVPIPYSW